MPQESMAKRVNPVATWDNVMLADETLRLLRTLASQARENQSERGGSGGAQGSDSRHGMIAIFTGESDADKTAAAEVLANDLDVKLYRIDLSSVASKWIWETEKNLSRLLSSAEEGDTILFFDEADALFGNRTSVGDDHNRYTSREAGFVMQLLETHRGLSILATSKPNNLDPAFTRRIRFIVAFDPPRAGGTRANLGLCVPGRSADRRPGCAAAGSTEHQWRTYPLDRAAGFFGRSIDGLHCDDGQCVGSRPTRDAQAGSTNQPARVSLTTDPLSRPSRMRTLSSGSRGHLIPR